jgi:hypothetical protein
MNLLGWFGCFGRRMPLSSGSCILSPWVGWPRPHRLGKTARNTWPGSASSSESKPPRVALLSTACQTCSGRCRFLVLAPTKSCHWRAPLAHLSLGELRRPSPHRCGGLRRSLGTFPSELRAVVGDDRVWDPKAVDDICKERNRLLGPDAG